MTDRRSRGVMLGEMIARLMMSLVLGAAVFDPVRALADTTSPGGETAAPVLRFIEPASGLEDGFPLSGTEGGAVLSDHPAGFVLSFFHSAAGAGDGPFTPSSADKFASGHVVRADLALELDPAIPHHFERRLDLERALAEVHYQQEDGLTLSRSAFVSAVDGLLMVRLAVGEPGILPPLELSLRPGLAAGYGAAPAESEAGMDLLHTRTKTTWVRRATEANPRGPEPDSPASLLGRPAAGLIWEEISERPAAICVRLLETDGRLERRPDGLRVSEATELVLAIALATAEDEESAAFACRRQLESFERAWSARDGRESRWQVALARHEAALFAAPGDTPPRRDPPESAGPGQLGSLPVGLLVERHPDAALTRSLAEAYRTYLARLVLNGEPGAED